MRFYEADLYPLKDELFGAPGAQMTDMEVSVRKTITMFEYEELPSEMQDLANAYRAKVLQSRPHSGETSTRDLRSLLRILPPLHTGGIVRIPLEELVRHRIAELNHCAFGGKAGIHRRWMQGC